MLGVIGGAASACCWPDAGWRPGRRLIEMRRADAKDEVLTQINAGPSILATRPRSPGQRTVRRGTEDKAMADLDGVVAQALRSRMC